MLDIAWNPTVLQFGSRASRQPVNKSTVLSKIAKLFDPLGWISPAIVTLKIFMQSLWALTKEWDQVLPDKHVEYWQNIYTSLEAISKIRIPRWIGVQPQSCSFEFHGFADACKLAYAGVVYLRVLSNQSQIYLLEAKTKVASVKTLSIPHLELCAAQLATKLTSLTLFNSTLPRVICGLTLKMFCSGFARFQPSGPRSSQIDARTSLLLFQKLTGITSTQPTTPPLSLHAVALLRS